MIRLCALIMKGMDFVVPTFKLNEFESGHNCVVIIYRVDKSCQCCNTFTLWVTCQLFK